MSSHRAAAGQPTSLSVLVLCSFNQTRSVMAEALLRDRFDRQLGPGAVAVRSAGFRSAGAPPTAPTIDALGRRHLDVTSHRSRRVELSDLAAADLVLCAERDHVLRVATMNPGSFARTFTIPEFAQLAGDTREATDSDATSVSTWIESLGAARDTATYLRGRVDEVADPTGGSRRRFEATAREIDVACDRIVDAILRRL